MTAALAPPREPPAPAGITVPFWPSTRLGSTAPQDEHGGVLRPPGEPVARRTPTQQAREARWTCEWWPPD
jgi:hypothetical protein